MAALALGAFLSLAVACAPNRAEISTVEMQRQAMTLAAVAKHESGLNPLTALDNSAKPLRSYTFPDLQTAIRTTTALIDAGHVVDVGVMAISSPNFRDKGLTVATAFEPCESIRVGCQMLLDAYDGGATPAQQQAALRRALSTYNTGDPSRGFANGYVRHVVAQAQSLPAIDAGSLPPSAAGDVFTPKPPERPPHEAAHGDDLPTGLIDALIHNRR